MENSSINKINIIAITGRSPHSTDDNRLAKALPQRKK